MFSKHYIHCFAAFVTMWIGGYAINSVYAHTSASVQKTCPLCSTNFICELDASGMQTGTRLDLKPLGPTAAPWRIPVCPKCHFVLYSNNIQAAELARCRIVVESDAYQSQSERESYYLWGLLFEGIDQAPLRIAHIFLKASWQEESNPEKLKDDLERSLYHFDRYLDPASGIEGTGQDYQTAQLLKGEILRRLGRFAEAKKHLRKFAGSAGIRGSRIAQLVAYEIKLCRKKDSSPHEVPAEKRKSHPAVVARKRATFAAWLATGLAATLTMVLVAVVWCRRRKRKGE